MVLQSVNLNKWRFYLKDLESPDLFINWSWIAAISSVLQRRVCVGAKPHESAFQIFPNLYIIFVGPPGVGKSISANKVKAMINQVNLRTKMVYHNSPQIKIGPQTTSLAALISHIATNFTLTEDDSLYQETGSRYYHHCSVSLFSGDEIENLLSSESSDLISFLNTAWDCGDYHKITKTMGSDVIKNMCLTILGCCTPEWIANSYANQILKGGFAARTIFVYGGQKRKRTPFITISREQNEAYLELVEHLARLTKVYGEIKLTKEAEELFIDWYNTSNVTRINHDKRLDYYYERKKIMVIKVAMCMHFSDKTNMELDVDDIRASLDILEETEKTMHLALMYTGRNALSSTALEIVEFLKESHRPVSEVEILKKFFSTNSRNEIKGVLIYLYETRQVKVKRINDQFYYELSEQNETDNSQNQPINKTEVNNDNSNRI